jgi:hypothetical protein
MPEFHPSEHDNAIAKEFAENLSDFVKDAATSDPYDGEAFAEEVAKSRGQIVVYPLVNEIQIDLDSREAFNKHIKSLEEFQFPNRGLYLDTWSFIQSKSKDCFHVYMKFLGKDCRPHVFLEAERMFFQAALGDDPVRVRLNAKRYFAGDDKPSRLFEFPDFDRSKLCTERKEMLAPKAEDDIF